MLSKKATITIELVAVVSAAVVVAAISRTPANAAPSETHYVAQYNVSGEMILPPHNVWREWLFVGSPLTPNALNSGKASFPEYHNVYIQP